MINSTNWLAQCDAVIRLSLQTILERKGASAAAAFGIAGVVTVLIGVLSIAQGFVRTLAVSGRPDTAVILRGGSDTEMMSLFGNEASRIIEECQNVARSNRGALVSPELFVIIDLPKKDTRTDANVPLRGVEPMAFEVHDEIQFVGGRRFEPGRNEIIAGIGAVAQFAGLGLGSQVSVGRDKWTVVGHFRAGGGVAESEIWTDASVLQDVYQRGSSYQSIYARLSSPAAFGKLKEELAANPRLNVKVLRQSEYYAAQSKIVSDLIHKLGTVIGGLMAVGAIFGALNTMYTAVAARRREIATLRALGFGGAPVVISVLIESLALAAMGGAFGAIIAYFAFDGIQSATLNWNSMSQVAFAFAVTPDLLARGIGWALAIGLIGGLLPAIRAARLPVARALQDY